MKTINLACVSSPAHRSFELISVTRGDAFTVRWQETIQPVVTFMLRKDHILIASAATKEEFRFTVGLNDEGRCQHRLNGQEYEQWQVHKMALKALFFLA